MCTYTNEDKLQILVDFFALVSAYHVGIALTVLDIQLNPEDSRDYDVLVGRIIQYVTVNPNYLDTLIEALSNAIS